MSKKQNVKVEANHGIPADSSRFLIWANYFGKTGYEDI